MTYLGFGCKRSRICAQNAQNFVLSEDFSILREISNYWYPMKLSSSIAALELIISRSNTTLVFGSPAEISTTQTVAKYKISIMFFLHSHPNLDKMFKDIVIY